MGASTFMQFVEGTDVDELFRNAVEEAQHEYGHGGYSGTIAEKDEYVVIDSDEVVTLADAEALATKLIDDADPRVDDKWGPAGAICCVDKQQAGWLFFGLASE